MKNGIVLFTTFLFLATACSEAPPQQPGAETKSSKLWTESDRNYILAELDRTTNEILQETDRLGNDQWFFQEDRTRWSIAAIIEHLTVQNEQYYRELSLAANMPEMPRYDSITIGQDELYRAYATAPEKYQAKWFLQPIGRFSDRRQSVDAFLRARDGLRGFVETTQVDLRRRYIFKKGAAEKNKADLMPDDIMDLHQLLLKEIAHTDRHLQQIWNIKKHQKYPRDI